jgi:hypothetical protein
MNRRKEHFRKKEQHKQRLCVGKLHSVQGTEGKPIDWSTEKKRQIAKRQGWKKVLRHHFDLYVRRTERHWRNVMWGWMCGIRQSNLCFENNTH